MITDAKNLALFASDAYISKPLLIYEHEHRNISSGNMFVRISRVKDTIVIAFRGTDDFIDWFYNISRWRRSFLDGKVKAHAGFLSYMRRLCPMVLETVFSMYTDVKDICVTGHSLAGGVAILFGAYFSYIHPTIKIDVVTFGAPRAGNSALKQWCNSRSNLSCTRVYNIKDIVTKLPYFGYCHIGKPLEICTPKLSFFRFKRIHSMDTYITTI